MVEPGARTPGLRDVLLVAVAVVGGVVGLAVITSVLPTGIREVLFKTPIPIAVLVLGTVGVLWRIGRPR